MSHFLSRLVFSPLFFVLLFSLNVLASSSTEVEEKKITQLSISEEWLNLLYYKSNGRKHKSLVVNPKFFFNPTQGSEDPRLEMKETIEAFRKSTETGNANLQCHFPARYQFLKKHFSLPPPVECPNFNQWFKSYEPNELSLVYTSQYISNPASIFGHLFLLLPSKKQAESFWMTFNFAAEMPKGTNGFEYTVGGLTGWFTGDYSIMPFYNRLFQYGNIENRDLWIYQLKVSKEELTRILNHFWELIHRSDFTYYFMDENCAGVLLRTFAATLTDMKDNNQLPSYVHPIEVIKALKKADRIKGVDFIPSQFNSVQNSYLQLNSEDQKAFHQIIDQPEKPLQIKSTSLADALVHYIAYLRQKNNGQLPNRYKPFERSVFLQRAQLPPKKSKKTSVPWNQAPHLAHKSSMVALGLSHLQDQTVLDLSYRFTVHHILDRQPGYLPNSTLEFGSIQLSAYDKEVWLREVRLIHLENFVPSFSFDWKGSWRAKLGFTENLLTSSFSDQFFQGKFAYGSSLWGKRNLLYALLSSNINIGKKLPQGHFELGPEIGFILNAKPFKGVFSAHIGEAIFEGSEKTFLNLKGGLRYSLSDNQSLIHESTWTRLIDQDLEGYRLSLSFRQHY